MGYSLLAETPLAITSSIL